MKAGVTKSLAVVVLGLSVGFVLSDTDLHEEHGVGVENFLFPWCVLEVDLVNRQSFFRSAELSDRLDFVALVLEFFYYFSFCDASK